MPNNKINIEDFWSFNNDSCWKIKREGMVDLYLYLPTGRYIYKSSISKKWYGTKNPNSMIQMSKKEKRKVKKFKNENSAVRWMAGLKKGE